MSKKAGPKDNFRVTVEPRSMTDFGGISTGRWMFYSNDEEGNKRWERDMQERCEEIAAEIKRHVDNVRSVWVEFDSSPICSHCGAHWTEDSNDYNGGCCDADQEAEDARMAATGSAS